jgi:DNA-binding transcriptional regulator YiaG
MNDADYIREELQRVGLSQRAFARLLDIGDREVRHWCAATVPLPYYARLVLAALPTRAA